MSGKRDLVDRKEVGKKVPSKMKGGTEHTKKLIYESYYFLGR